ncbi:MAG: hypothetical protein BGN95_03790 [Sphingomonas sp. 66-10]|uniref:hypothetical protein n=1 Tax=Sphingomonas sp. 66-10 TaxID=1895848 RepID=UPI0009260E23|nr:hypothetical protein [Sphingomonas sp. 66-10]OJU22699.1 MAG: hypothetical protein BGN95_03790 [Sphingomonas sp. 66-10]
MRYILLLSAAFANGGAFIEAGETVPVSDDKRAITDERAEDIVEAGRGEFREGDDDDELDAGDGLDAMKVADLKKLADEEAVDLGTAAKKDEIVAAIRAAREA